MLRPFLAVARKREIEIDREKLFRLYIKKYFLYDLLSTIPFDYVVLSISDNISVRYFRLHRFLKIYRLFETEGIFRKHTTVNVPLVRIILIFISSLLFAHWFNCILLLICRWEYNADRRYDGRTILGTMPFSTLLPPPDQMTIWELYANLYTISICFMASIMYGDIIPFTITEETVSIFFMLLGRIALSFMYAEVSQYVRRSHSAYDRHTKQHGLVFKWF